MSKVSLLGAGETVVTLKADGNVNVGQPVKLTADFTAKACVDGDTISGVCVSKSGDYLGVQLRGYLNVKYSGTLNYGWQYLIADNDGGVKAASIENPTVQSSSSSTVQVQGVLKGRQCLVTDIDSTSMLAGILL